MTATAKVRRNPYIIGRPISEPEQFFGRESLFDFIEDNLNQGIKVILLHGQRRIGKSSVLSQIPNFVGKDKFVFVSFDLHDQSQSLLHKILHSLAKEVSSQLQLNAEKVKVPTVEELETEANIFSRDFLPEVYQALAGRNLVLLLDEFDVLNNSEFQLGFEHFFPYLQSILKQEDKLFVIPVVGRQLDDMPKLLKLYKGVPHQKIGLLDELSAKRLITKPTEGVLDYEPDAIQAILELSAGHPYFTQVICHAVFAQARSQENWRVTRTDVESIIDRAIEIGEGGLTWFWDGLPIRERIVFSAVAEVQRSHQPEESSTVFVNAEECWQRLRDLGVVLTESLPMAEIQLVKWDFLLKEYPSKASWKTVTPPTACLKVTIELVRRWIVKRHSLCREIRELEKLDSEANKIYESAIALRQGDDIQKSLKHYEQVLALNPNHFSALLDLAHGYLETQDFAKAVQVYQRAYKVDPIRTEEGYMRSLLNYGSQLMEQREFRRAVKYYTLAYQVEPERVREELVRSLMSYGQELMQPQFELARRQFEEILKIENDNSLAQKKLKEIEQHCLGKKNQYRLALATIVGISILIGSGLSGWFIRDKLAVNSLVVGTGNNQNPGVLNNQELNSQIHQYQWEPTRFSRGERRLFTSTESTNFNRGIEAFKQSYYFEAAEFFDKAYNEKRTDPEALIYYNNAIARQKSPPLTPLTLAVVVPVENRSNVAQETLRGVAQAQKEFNESREEGNQLLEIVIANDGDNPEYSGQVAQKLINDKSVIGVIGHNDSDASQAALSEYQKSNLAMISPSSTSTKLTSNVFFRTVPSDEVAGKKLSDYAKDQGIDSVIIFYSSNNIYSQSLKDAFKNHFSGEVKEIIDLSDRNLNVNSEFLSRMTQNQVSAALFFPDQKNVDAALSIAKANSKLPPKEKLKLLLGGDVLYNPKILEDWEAVKGLILAVPWFREEPEAKEFIKAAEKQWGTQQVSWRTAASYDATKAFIEAIKKVLSDDQQISSDNYRPQVLERLRKINLASDATSGDRLEFKDGERQGSEPVLVQVNQSKFELVEKPN